MKKQSNPSSDDPDKVPEFFLDKDKIEKLKMCERKRRNPRPNQQKRIFLRKDQIRIKNHLTQN